MVNTQLKSLIVESRKLFGESVDSKHLRKQWVKKTYELKSRGIHVLQTGKFPSSQPIKTSKQILEFTI
jgi:hypothetical protein